MNAEQMFGCSLEQLAATLKAAEEHQDRLMIVASMISDAQEMMAHKRHEDARQALNRAKYVLVLERERVAKES